MTVIPAFTPPIFHLLGWNPVEAALSKIDRELHAQKQPIGGRECLLRLVEIFFRSDEDVFIVCIPVPDFKDAHLCTLQAGRGEAGI